MESVDAAFDSGRIATGKLSRDEQKELGQFLTPPGIARFMAQRCTSGNQGDVLRILEPAAGAGILAAAVVEAILAKEDRPKAICVTLFEIDKRLLPALRRLASRLRPAAQSHGVKLSVSIRCEDFLLSREATQQVPIADIIIANPPYFKIGAKDPRTLAHAYAVHGQPNIYGLFMAACAGLIAAGGQWCFITPRSWTNGAYFSAMRRHILRHLAINAIHVFESREEHFTDDEILQEAMITWASSRAATSGQVILSSSRGMSDIGKSVLHSRTANEVISNDQERLIALRTGNAPLDRYTETLESHGLKVSTGPVVAFRATSYLRTGAGKTTVPLLWMQHINHMRIQWPIQKKREHIAASAASAWMLVPNSPMVVMRRFSPKEAPRRVTAAAYIGDLPGDVLGLENHLNYFYRPGGVMTPNEAVGLAAYLNSGIVDIHLRAIAGSTQVNATELRRLPLPTSDRLIKIGMHCRPGMSFNEIDEVVDRCLMQKNRKIA